MDHVAEFQGARILLLAEPGSFHAAYIRRSLQFFGVPVLAPDGRPSDVFTELSGDDWETISGCIAVDVGPALFADIARTARNVPCLFAGAYAGAWFPGPYTWICPPFASYQIVEALFAMLPGVPLRPTS